MTPPLRDGSGIYTFREKIQEEWRGKRTDPACCCSLQPGKLVSVGTAHLADCCHRIRNRTILKLKQEDLKPTSIIETVGEPVCLLWRKILRTCAQPLRRNDHDCAGISDKIDPLPLLIPYQLYCSVCRHFSVGTNSWG